MGLWLERGNGKCATQTWTINLRWFFEDRRGDERRCAAWLSELPSPNFDKLKVVRKLAKGRYKFLGNVSGPWQTTAAVGKNLALAA